MKIVFTGGHFSPAYSVIQELDKKAEIVVLGRKNALEGDKSLSFEYKVCQDLKIPFYEVRAGRLSRKLTKFGLYSFLKLPLGFYDALRILRKTKPDIVLAFGGYISFPVTIAANILGIPVVLHEQTQGAGFANKSIARFATRVCVSFESSIPYFPKNKVILTGNPVRREIFEEGKPVFDLGHGEKFIYITGGSTGSHFINILTKDVIEELLSEFIVVHQTGNANNSGDFKLLTEEKEKLPHNLAKRYIVREFIMPDEIGWILKNASLVVSRAGINSVCEYIALNCRALLIPLPHGQKGEQLENARLLKNSGYGDYILQSEVTAEKFLEKISILASENIKSEDISKTKQLSRDAAKKIKNVLQLVYEKKQEKKV